MGYFVYVHTFLSCLCFTLLFPATGAMPLCRTTHRPEEYMVAIANLAGVGIKNLPGAYGRGRGLSPPRMISPTGGLWLRLTWLRVVVHIKLVHEDIGTDPNLGSDFTDTWSRQIMTILVNATCTILLRPAHLHHIFFELHCRKLWSKRINQSS